MVSIAGFSFDLIWARQVRPDVGLRAPDEDDQMHHVEVTAGHAVLSPVVDDVGASFGASRDSCALDIGSDR